MAAVESEFRALLLNLQAEFDHFLKLNNLLEGEVGKFKSRVQQLPRKKTKVAAEQEVQNVDTTCPSIAGFAGTQPRFKPPEDPENFSAHDRTTNLKECACLLPHDGTPPPSDTDMNSPTQSMQFLQYAEKNASPGAMTAATITTAFDSEDSTREERLHGLANWFSRLSEGESGLSISRLQDIMESVLGFKEAITDLDIHVIIKHLEKESLKHLGKSESKDENDIHGSHSVRSSGRARHTVNIAGTVMRFHIFADIIIFDRMQDVPGKMYQDIILLRDCIMRSHLDEVVSQYAHLPQTKTGSTSKMTIGARLVSMINPIVAVALLANGVTIGISSDIEWEMWDAVELCFTVFFLFEILLKVCVHGAREHFFGPEWRWNWFDAIIVGMACIDLALTCLVGISNLKDFTLMRLARMVRLTRLIRILRVLRLNFFKELLLMVKGVVSGLKTLFWAFIMLCFLVYACGVVLRQTIGEEGHVLKDGTMLFGSLGWSMFNVFRCFMSDCNLPDGSPLASYLYELHGALFVIPYTISIMFIVFGIFNMVTAVFVDSVMESARQRQIMSKEAEQQRVGQLLSELVYKLASRPIETMRVRKGSNASYDSNIPLRSSQRSTSREIGHRFLAKLSSITSASNSACAVVCRELQSEVKRDTFIAALRDPHVVKLIDDLEIQIGDRSELFDVIDSDGSGSIDIGELIAGIMKMRSVESKQDIVAIILGIRGMRNSIQDIAKSASDTSEQLSVIQQTLRIGHPVDSANVTADTALPEQALPAHSRQTSGFCSDDSSPIEDDFANRNSTNSFII